MQNKNFRYLHQVFPIWRLKNGHTTGKGWKIIRWGLFGIQFMVLNLLPLWFLVSSISAWPPQSDYCNFCAHCPSPFQYLQCFDTIGWVAGKASSPQKTRAGIVTCLQQGANDSHMVQLMPLPLPPHHLCFSKIQHGLSIWYRLTLVVLEKDH